MFIPSRVVPLARRLLSIRHVASKHLQQTRNIEMTWSYRTIPPASGPGNVRFKRSAEALMGFMWYWILWHLWYDFDHLVGHYDYPDRSRWTDEELGIPPEDED